MRLTDFEKTTIKDTARNVFGPNVRIFLFGSRVDDSVKGGDIDIYIESENHARLEDKISFISRLKLKLGDQEIDVILNTPDKKEKNIYDIARETGVEI